MHSWKDSTKLHRYCPLDAPVVMKTSPPWGISDAGATSLHIWPVWFSPTPRPPVLGGQQEDLFSGCGSHQKSHDKRTVENIRSTLSGVNGGGMAEENGRSASNLRGIIARGENLFVVWIWLKFFVILGLFLFWHTLYTLKMYSRIVWIVPWLTITSIIIFENSNNFSLL